MSDTARAILLGFFVLATSIWVGGYVAIAVVARVASHTLAPAQRISLFRGLGRTYGVIGGLALLAALGTGAALVSDQAWGATLTATTVVAGALLLSTALGIVQARRMTRLRRTAVAQPQDAALAVRIREGARNAGLLRAVIGALSLALIALGSLLAT